MPGVKMPALPVWNRKKTDILPEYQLTYGHMICETSLTPDAIGQMAECIGLGELVHWGSLDVERLPVDSKVGCRNLGTNDNAHLLVSEVCGNYLVFGPHKLFFNNIKWIEWNKANGGVMAVATQHDDTITYYRVFRCGSYLMIAEAYGSSIGYQEEDKIQISVDGVLVVDEPGGMPPQDPEVDAVLASDARIVVEGERIYVRELISGKPVENLVHYVFVKDA